MATKTTTKAAVKQQSTTLYNNTMKHFLIMNRLCNLLNGRTKAEIIWMFEASGDDISESMFEKILRTLRETFDAPIGFNYKTNTYILENYDFKAFILASF